MCSLKECDINRVCISACLLFIFARHRKWQCVSCVIVLLTLHVGKGRIKKVLTKLREFCRHFSVDYIFKISGIVDKCQCILKETYITDFTKLVP